MIKNLPSSLFIKSRLAVVLSLFMFLPLSLLAQIKDFKQGKLSNGLTYYIYHDTSTPGEAQYYLYQNVGAVLENESEIGLAHVLEHLAFNTTNNFSQGIMSFLRSNNLNDFEAYTGVDETRYAVYNVPTANPSLQQQMLLVLKDWCHGIKILPKDVEKERAIILEEWRHRAGVNRRITDSIARVVYNNSIYSNRNVIGTEARLHSFTAKEVRSFYDKWYRPNLQYIAIIGDIDVNETEALIQKTFKDLPSKTAPTQEGIRTIADNAQPLYMRFIDKENKMPSFGLYQRKSIDVNASTDSRSREFIFTQMFNTLAPRRFAMLRNADKEAFIGAQVSYSSLVRGQYQMAWDVVPYNNRGLEALQQLLDLRNTLRVKGFTKQEFEAQKEELYKGMKEALEAKGLGTPDNVMNLCKQNFLLGTPIVDFRTQIQQNLEALVELEVEDINQWLQQTLNDNNLSFVTYSRNEAELNITKNQFLQALEQSKSHTNVAPQTVEPIASLIDFNIKSGSIVSEKPLKKIGAVQWTLSNGARVLYKYLPKAGDKFLFAGSTEGGKSILNPEELANYTAMRSLLMQSGVYKYNRNQLASWLQNKDLSLNLSLEDYSNGIGGNASVAHADDFFSYLYLILTRQNFSQTVFDKYVQRSKYLYSNANKEGMEAVQDSIRLLLFPETPANPVQNEAFYNSMQFNELPKAFEKQLGNAAHFTYCLVGNIPADKAKSLITRYIASLPANASQPAPKHKALDFSSAEPQIKHTYTTDLDGDMGEIEISFANKQTLTDKEQAALEVMRGLLENRLFDELREKEHLTYTIGVQTNYTAQPTASENLSIHLSTARTQVPQVLARVYKAIEDIKAKRFGLDAFKNVVVPLAVNDEAPVDMASQDQSALWLSVLNIYSETGEEVSPEESLTVEPLFSKLSPEDVAQVAAKVLQNAKHREIVVQSIEPTKRSWEK